MHRLLALAAIAASIVTAPIARADDLPGRDWRPMGRVIADLARLGYAPVAKVEAEHGVWEVRAFSRGTLYDIEVDPHSGRIREAKRVGDGSCPIPRPVALRPAQEKLRPAHPASRRPPRAP